MTATQTTLALEPPTLAEAMAQADQAMAAALEAADTQWARAVEDAIWIKPAGFEFIGEDIVLSLVKVGMTTSNAKAIGPIIRRLAKTGVITATGNARRAKTSHGSLKPVWRRTEKW